MRSELIELASGLRPVGLAELEAHAALRRRTERKYVVDAAILADLCAELAPSHRVLEVSDGRLVPYASVYFDTPELVGYREHVQGRRRRFKCRMRRYGPAGPCFFEVKLRDGRGQSFKRRLERPAGEHGRLAGPSLSFLSETLRADYGRRPPDGLVGVLRSSFERLTLGDLAAGERVTVDTELTLAAPGVAGHRIRPGRVLVETKALLPGGGAEGVLRRLGARPLQGCSKFCLGLALAYPDLTDNPFGPVLRAHFGGSP